MVEKIQRVALRRHQPGLPADSQPVLPYHVPAWLIWFLMQRSACPEKKLSRRKISRGKNPQPILDGICKVNWSQICRQVKILHDSPQRRAAGAPVFKDSPKNENYSIVITTPKTL